MNSKTLSLTSTNTSGNIVFPVTNLTDHTTLTLLLTGVTERMLPNYLQINWGDGKVDYFENDILQQANLIEDQYSSILFEPYTHEYYPSDTSLSKNLSVICSVNYINNDQMVFTLPLSIINYNYNDSIEDLYLINTNILPQGGKIHQFVSKKDGFLIEIKTNE